ncbi:MAG: DMT family transporter [Gaiellaceae bacterium]
MDAVLLATLAGVLFGAFAVAVRVGLHRDLDPEGGAFVAAALGFVVAALLAVSLALRDGANLRGLWAFALVGLFVPGLSQIVFVRAIRDAGASRTAVVIGTAPLLSAGLALVFLDEPFRPALVVATFAIVLGGALLVWEPERPSHFHAVGIWLALLAATLFAVRDNLVRWLSLDSDADPLLAATVSLGAASLALFAYLATTRRARPVRARVHAALPAFAPAAVCLGLAYVALLLAFSRGDVTVVAPLNATQSLWGVLLASTFLGRSEAVGPRLVLAAALVVAGGVLIGATR